mgnify:CR=1 FL=1
MNHLKTYESYEIDNEEVRNDTHFYHFNSPKNEYEIK